DRTASSREASSAACLLCERNRSLPSSPYSETRERGLALRPSLALGRVGAQGGDRVNAPARLSPKPQGRASDPSASAWVSANAGSGKTHVLVDRVIRLLLAGTEPQRILCLTFTKAAAAEMNRRL